MAYQHLTIPDVPREADDALRQMADDFQGHIGADNPHDQYLLESDALQLFAFAAYGGMYLNTPGDPGWDIGLGWQTIDVYDTLAVATPRGVTISLANSSLAFDNLGVYVFSIGFSFEHNSSNQGRRTYLRAYNLTDDIPGGTLGVIGIGRNTEATNYSITALVEIDSASVNDEIVVQIGGIDTILVDSFETAGFDAWNVGEWQQALPSNSPP